MRIKSILFFTAFVVLIIAIQSCKKKPTPVTPTPPAVLPPSFSFTALGITTSGVQYTISNPTYGPLQITGLAGDSSGGHRQTVTIVVNNVVNLAGTFTLSTTNTGVYTSGTNTIRYSTNASNVGTINISKVDMTNRLMSASYNFVAEQTAPSNTGSGTISGSFTNVGF